MASKINADEFVDREGEGKPTLPKGVVLSGVTTITTAVVAENEVANSTGINAGIITSTHFKGNLTGDVNAGIVTVSSQTIVGSAVTISASGIDIGAGVITATSYAGSGANLTGIGATIMIWEYNPDPSDSAVTLASGIGITFNQKIKAGSGNITLREDSASGTVVENFGVGSSVTIANNSLSFTPTSNLDENVTYFVDIPSSSITNMAGDSYVGTGYTFQTTYTEYQLWAWGYNADGNLGLNDITYRSSPVQVPGITWSKPARGWGNTDGGGEAHSGLTSKTDGTLWSWGRGENGQLGLNDVIARSSPTQIPGTTWGTHQFIGGQQRGAIKTDGTLWVWGVNTNGTLGQNNRTNYSSPVQIPGTTWKWVEFGNANSMGVKTDGTLWSWGYSRFGELGQNSNVRYSSPVQIPGTWSTCAAGYYHMIAIRTNGTLWVWGDDSYGSLAQNPVDVRRSSPVQVPGTTWASCSGGQHTSMGTKTDGTLWTWGAGGYGAMGVNTNIKYSSPVQIPGTTWSQTQGDTSIHNNNAAALKTDGTLWVWGTGGSGQNAQNDRTQYSSPVQVPGTWVMARSNANYIFATKQT